MGKLEFYRRRAGLSVKKLALKMSVHPVCVTQVERGVRKPWPKFRRAAAEALGIPEYELWDDSDNLAKFLCGGDKPLKITL